MKKALILVMVLCFFIISTTGCNKIADSQAKRGRNQTINSFLEEIEVPVFFSQPNGYPRYEFDYVNDDSEKVHAVVDLSTFTREIRIEVSSKESHEIIHGFIDHSNRTEYAKAKIFKWYDDATFDEYYKKFGFEKKLESFSEERQEELLIKYFCYLQQATRFLQEAKGIN